MITLNRILISQNRFYDNTNSIMWYQLLIPMDITKLINGTTKSISWYRLFESILWYRHFAPILQYYKIDFVIFQNRFFYSFLWQNEGPQNDHAQFLFMLINITFSAKSCSGAATLVGSSHCIANDSCLFCVSTYSILWFH